MGELYFPFPSFASALFFFFPFSIYVFLFPSFPLRSWPLMSSFLLVYRQSLHGTNVFVAPVHCRLSVRFFLVSCWPTVLTVEPCRLRCVVCLSVCCLLYKMLHNNYIVAFSASAASGGGSRESETGHNARTERNHRRKFIAMIVICCIHNSLRHEILCIFMS